MDKIEIGDTVITKVAYIVNEDKTIYPGEAGIVVRVGNARNSFVVQFKEDWMQCYEGKAYKLPSTYVEGEFHINLLAKKIK